MSHDRDGTRVVRAKAEESTVNELRYSRIEDPFIISLGTMASQRGMLYLLQHKLPAVMKPRDFNFSSIFDRLSATKIGFTKTPTHESVAKRIGELNTGNPFPLFAIAAIPCTLPSLWEKYLKKHFELKKVDREWYSFSSMDHKFIQGIVEDCEKAGQRPDRALFDKIMLSQTPIQSAVKTVLNNSKVHDTPIQHEPLVQRYHRSYLNGDDGTAFRFSLEQSTVVSKPASMSKSEGYWFNAERVDGSQEEFSYHSCFGQSETTKKGFNFVRGPTLFHW